MPLIILPFISQVMSPAEYGAASLLTASSLFLVTIVAAPLEALVFRAAARPDDNSQPALRIAGLYCYVVVPTSFAIIGGAIPLFSHEILGVKSDLWTIALIAVGFQPAMTYFAVPLSQARRNLARYASITTMSIVLLASSKIMLLVVWQLGVFGWVLSDLIGALTSAALAMTLVRLPPGPVDRRHIRFVANFVVPLVPHRASVWAIRSLSKPALAIVSSLTQVGLLSLGQNIASIATLLLAEINRAALPQYSRESFPAPTAQTYRPASLQMVLAFAIPSLVASALALVGQYVFPQSYWDSFSISGILLIGQAAFGLYIIPSNYLIQTAGATKQIGLVAGASAIIVLASLPALGKNYGAMGAALATTVGFFGALLMSMIMPRILRLRIRWRSWVSHWPEISLSILALVGSTASLLLPVGSTPARVLAAASTLPVVIALVLHMRFARPSQ
nr:oligosaccharide flippase family protein [Mycolicibacterium elephantis]